jgi:hydrogenase nickel incorporation protein HypA/HybF
VRGFVRAQAAVEFIEAGTVAFHLDAQAVTRVPDPAGQLQFRGEAMDERTEADALHRAVQSKFQPHGGVRASDFPGVHAPRQACDEHSIPAQQHLAIFVQELPSAVRRGHRRGATLVARMLMHEVAIMAEAVRMAEESARAAGARRITGVRLRVGTLSGAVPEAMQFAWDVVRRESLAAGAWIEIETVTAMSWCETCQAEFACEHLWNECPRCRELSGDVRRGRELELAAVEIE